MTKSYADTCLDRAEKAHKELYRICGNPSRYFRMSIPVQITDSDVVLQFTINDCEELARRLKKACEMLRKPKRNIDLQLLAEELEGMPGEK